MKPNRRKEDRMSRVLISLVAVICSFALLLWAMQPSKRKEGQYEEDTVYCGAWSCFVALCSMFVAGS
ncbi:MAG: hypothetical protein OYG31_02810 [Candidatus Kaiserbacteria bacterium]|nr:hypothetical protein [Candidatus Kaiserbacteria bacterium]